MSQTDLHVTLLDQALKLALSIADDMTRAETLEGLAVAYAEAGQTARAATLLRRIWQMARHQSNASDRQWQLRCAAEACVEANLEELAVAIAADLVRASDRASVAVDLAKHHVNAGRLPQATARLAEALDWVRRAEEAGEGTSFTRREIAETAVDLGLIEHAVRVASALDHHQLAVRALCAVAVRWQSTGPGSELCRWPRPSRRELLRRQLSMILPRCLSTPAAIRRRSRQCNGSGRPMTGLGLWSGR